MSKYLAIIAMVLASPAAMAGDTKSLPVLPGEQEDTVTVTVRTREWRIFPSLPDPYRSGTVPLHFLFKTGWGEGDSTGFKDDNTGSSRDRLGTGNNGFFCCGGPTNIGRSGPMSSPRSVGGRAVGPGGTIGGGV